MFRTASGLGAWARSNYRILKTCGFDVIAVDVSDIFASIDLDCSIPFSSLPKDASGTIILHVNGPETAHCLHKLGLRRDRSWRVIGAWAWELETFPAGWERAFPLISEIWALSDFAADTFRKHPQAPPVRVLPISVSPPPGLLPKEQRPTDPFTVLVMADALSTLERKNPDGAVRAFRLAFGERADCRLVVKLRNLDSTPAARDILLATIGGAQNITLIESALSETEQYVFISNADVFLSLHRAEGFGLGPAEAMAMGVPVIATNWSGNLQYMDEDSAALVPFILVPVPQDCPHYNIAGAEWAEPDVNAAAEWLRRLEEDPEYKRNMASRAMLRVAETCGESAVRTRAMQYLAAPPSEQ